MFQFSQLPSKYIIMITMITIAILPSLVTFTSAEITDITHVSVMEGKNKEIDFRYPCNVSEVTLQHSHKAPFYDSANPELVSSENQELSVHEERNECFIRLFFTPALRSDEGGYILTLYAPGRIFQNDIRVWLNVDYPPGSASCELSGEHITDGWASLKCTAPAGTSSLSGEIICYQYGIVVSYLPKPAERRDDILVQTLWVKHSSPAFCCAVVKGRPVGRCDCKDYKWDPYKNVTDPCPHTTPQAQKYDSRSSQSYSPLSMIQTTGVLYEGAPIIPVNTTKPNSNVKLHASYSFIVSFLTLIVIGLSIALVLSHRKASQCRRHRKASQCSRQCHVTRSSEATGEPDGNGYTGMRYIGQQAHPLI